jgi:hypothetical protein
MSQHVLFVGNSYTFYNDVPAQVAALAVQAGQPMTVETVAEGGAHVELHWTETGARERIERGGFDVLVLQDQSGGPLHDRSRFEKYAPRLAELGQKRGARLVWYQTWARAAGHEAYESAWSGGSREEMTLRIRDAYHDMAKRCGGEVAPVGDAWLMALVASPDLVLHDEDLHHAAPPGSHLAALVIAATIVGLDPRQATFLPDDVPAELAPTLREAAHLAVQ